MGRKVNQMPIKGSFKEPHEKKGLHLPVIVQKECWIFLSFWVYTRQNIEGVEISISELQKCV